MVSKSLFLVLVSVLSLQGTFGQDEFVRCNFNSWICNANVNNPNGRDDFTEIGGQLPEGFTNDDITRIGTWDTLLNTTILPSIFCEKFINIDEIFISSRQIQKITSSTLRGCKKLVWLWHESGLVTIEEDAFVNNLELDRLLLRMNQLETLRENVFRNQNELKHLNLDQNRIYDLPGGIFRSLRNLETLNLAQNLLRELKVEWFETLGNLDILTLNDNQIEELPKNVFSNLKSLSWIILFRNNLKVIHSDSFGFLPNSIDAEFQKNQIYAIDPRFIEDTGLYCMNVRWNLCVNTLLEGRSQLRTHLAQCFYNYEKTDER